MFSIKRLSRQSQSVDLPGFPVRDAPSSLVTKATGGVVAVTTEEQQNSPTNQRLRSGPRRGELKRGFTIDEGQKRDGKDGRRLTFQQPAGTTEYRVESRDTLNSIALKFNTTPNELVTLNKLFSRAVIPGKILYVPDPDFVSSAESSPFLSPISPLSLSSPEPDLLQPSDRIELLFSTQEERFLKIRCKYITDSQGAVGGVLLLTPTAIMFDPQRSDPLVEHRGCDQFGIMAALEEVMSAAMCTEVTDPRVRGHLPHDLQLPPDAADLGLMTCVTHSNMEDSDLRANENTNSAGSSLSKDVFIKSEVSLLLDNDTKPCHMTCHTPSQYAAGLAACLGQTPERAAVFDSGQQGAEPAGQEQEPEEPEDTEETEEPDRGQLTARQDSTANQEAREKEAGSEGAPQEKEEEVRKMGAEFRFLCVRVSRPMMKTFVSPSSAAMQRYAQQHRNTHQYWFAVPAERSDPLLSFFTLWSPDTFTEERGVEPEGGARPEGAAGAEGGAGPVGRLPGFVVVKRNQDLEPGSVRPPVPDITAKDWEVVSTEEYQRRVDALNSEDLQALCRRLQICTRPESSLKLGAAGRSEEESETFRPSLSHQSDLLTPQHIQELVKHLPPRTIGYPWTLAFSTANHGSSIKTFYRNMAGLNTPILMVLKDCDGQVFGALASEPLRVSDCFYGTGETFLFSFCPQFEVFKWTGDNMFFLKGDVDSLTFGGGGEFGLWLDGDLYHGRSNTCRTFGNPRLTQREDFVLQHIEAWAFH